MPRKKLSEEELKANHAESMRKWKAANKEKLAEYQRRYYKAHKQRILETRKANPNTKAYSKKWAEENREKIADTHRRWLKENRDRWNAYQREYHRNKKALEKAKQA